MIGTMLRKTGHPAEAHESLEQARAIRDRLAREHPESPGYASDLGGTIHNLAQIDFDQGQFDKARTRLTEAIQWQRKALAANPNQPVYRQYMTNHLTGLIRAAVRLGRSDEAALARRELAELAASDPAKAALDARLAAVLRGKESPKNAADRIALAFRANQKKLYASSAHLYTETLASDPKLAEDRKTRHRYNAACAAALAASGQSKDEPQPDAAAAATLRGKARDWLKAELAAWAKVLDTGPAQFKAVVPKTLEHWKTDSDLAGIRDEKELAKLSDAERAALKELWNDVDRVLKSAVASQ